MSKLVDVLHYIYSHYPSGRKLTPWIATKIAYLSDWKSSIDDGRQITDAEWNIDEFEPHAIGRDIAQCFVDFVKDKNNTQRWMGKLFGGSQLSRQERRIIDHVIDIAAKYPDEEFVHLVYSTYPAITKDSSDPIDLPTLAKEYKETQQAMSKRLNQKSA